MQNMGKAWVSTYKTSIGVLFFMTLRQAVPLHHQLQADAEKLNERVGTIMQ